MDKYSNSISDRNAENMNGVLNSKELICDCSRCLKPLQVGDRIVSLTLTEGVATGQDQLQVTHAVEVFTWCKQCAMSEQALRDQLVERSLA